MEIRIAGGPAADVEADALVVLAFEGQAPEGIGSAWLKDLYAAEEFNGKFLETALHHGPEGVKAKRLLAVGVGKPGDFKPAVLRRAVGAAIRKVKGKGVRHAAVLLEGAAAGDDFASAAVEGALLGDFEPDQYKTDAEKKSKPVESLTVCGGSAAAVEQGRIVAEAQNFARTLANEPANLLTPTTLAARARTMAEASGLECEVLDRDRMQQLGMGALLGVAQGSAEPPALIVIRYRPEGAAADSAHLGLVGKGVTFDTGGISIKPSDGMEKMKYDMAGGAAMLGRHAGHRATETAGSR